MIDAPADAPRRAALGPLLAAVVASECALALVADFWLERIGAACLASGVGAWLTRGMTPADAAAVARESSAYALTGIVRLLQVVLVRCWVRRARLDPLVGVRLRWSGRAAATAGALLVVIALGAGFLELVCRTLAGTGFVRPVLLGGPDPALGTWPFLALSLATQAIAGPLAEETICRGLVYVPLRRRSGICAALVASALVFALVHRTLDPVGFALVATGGAIFAAACEIGGGLAAPILVHAIYNGTLLLLRHPACWG